MHGYLLGTLNSIRLFRIFIDTSLYASIVDMHSHLGVDSSPGLRGASDGNSRKGPILPVSKCDLCNDYPAKER